MRRTVEMTAVIVLAASLSLVGCADPLPTGAVNDASYFTRPPAVGFEALRRTVPLSVDLSVTRVIGRDGGRLEIDEAGITFVIAPDALTEATTITMTALAGDAMAVEFAPHGLEFAIPATMHMLARGTPAEAQLLHEIDGEPLDLFLAVYFDGNPEIGVDPLENIATYLLDGAIVFRVGHFSGYVVATGRKGKKKRKR